MKLAIMQPYLFPYIGYFQLIKVVDKFVILDDVNFIKKGWINRNRILVNRREYLFSVPLKHASQNKLIKDVQISNEIDWKNKLIKTIELSYKKAPYFNEVIMLIKDIILYDEDNLSKYILNSLIQLNKYLAIATKIVPTSVIYNNSHLTGQKKIIDICLQENATHYINTIGGKELYDLNIFANHGIKLSFIKSCLIQ